ncbi:MAG TPA: Ig-like domain-containing protein [Gemmatimonadaceae bacterium]|nr:Ig-like domain-containing protein [Gemmatimonadaceae bacterium]
MRRLIAFLTASFGIATASACASAGAPPGGPERHVPPAIVSITPDSGATNVKPKNVVIRFDEVVSDRPAGSAAQLDQAVLVSPRNGDPVVSWHRTHIDVHPRKGFLPNTAYRVTLLPGIADLRGNVIKEPRTIVFSTGATFPRFGIIGQVFDWNTQRPAVGAYVEAISHPDTAIVYLASTDSVGQFDIGPMPAGTYTVRGLIDKNSNRVVDRGEQWDTTTVTITETRPTVELDAIERDSVPAYIENVDVLDSVTLGVHFDKPLDPRIPLQPALVRVQRADSSELQVTNVQWLGAYQHARAAQDSARRADSVKAAAKPAAAAPPTAAAPPAAARTNVPPPPKPRAPPPDRGIAIMLAPSTPVVPGQSYTLTARGMRNLVGHDTILTRRFTASRPAPKDTTHAVRPDSLKPKPDTSGRAATPPRKPPR